MEYLNYDGVIYFWSKIKKYIAECIANLKKTIDNYTINGYKISENPVLTKADVGLGNVDNVSSKDAPISDKVQAALDKKVDKTTTINGHALDGNVTITKGDVGLGNVDNTSDLDKPISTATQAALDKKVDKSSVGQANGVASLDGSGKVPSSQLPSYVDDVLEYDTLNDFPATGETGKIYIAKDTNYSYRWSGSTYIYIANPDTPITNDQIDKICV